MVINFLESTRLIMKHLITTSDFSNEEIELLYNDARMFGDLSVASGKGQANHGNTHELLI